MNRSTAVTVLTLFVAASAAQGEPLCDPSADPCVADRPIVVAADEADELNLGLRGVRAVSADHCRLDACTATIASGASLTCDEDNFRIRVEKALTVEKHARLAARRGGGVIVTVPSAAIPIVLEGNVTPDPQIVEDATLSLCANP